MIDKNIVLLFDNVQTKYGKLNFGNEHIDELYTQIVYSKRDDPDPKIIPIFYTHREEEKYVNEWIADVINFFNRHKDFIELTNNKIVVCDLLESNRTLAKSVEIVSNYVQKIIYVVTPNYKVISTNKVKFLHNPTFYKFLWPIKNTLKYKPKKLYINLNRAYRYHRALLIDNLYEHNLLKCGYTTFGDAYNDINQYIEENPNSNLDKIKFDILDEPDLKNVNPVYKYPAECKKSFLFLNTETWVDNDRLFLTEKSFKPAGIGMPFINLGNPGTLAKMRELGFYTFSPWIDESYDLDLPLQQRIDIVIENLKRLSQHTDKELIKIRNQMNYRIQHNHRLYNIFYNKNFTNENFQLIVNGAV